MSPAEIDAARKLAAKARDRRPPCRVCSCLRTAHDCEGQCANCGSSGCDGYEPDPEHLDVPALADALTAALDALAAAEARAERAAQWQALAEAATATHAAEQRAHERALDALVEVTARAERAEALLAPVQAAARARQGAYCDGLYDGAHLERALFLAAMGTIAGEP